MSLPQSFVLFKRTVLGAALLPVFYAGPVAAQQDDPPRPTLFSCGTDEANDAGFLDLSGIEEDTGVFTQLRFERTAEGDGHPVYVFPPPGIDPETAFLFSHSDGVEGYLVSVRWRDGDTDYVYYSLDIPPVTSADDDVGGGMAGLAISRNGVLVERVPCIERPYMFISYMREATSCDATNPYGPAACADDAPDRATILDVTKIGIVGAAD